MEDHLRDLKELGMVENEAKAYLNLLVRNYSAVELSKLLNVNRTNIYKIINRLIERGFCSKTTETNKFAAIDPKIAFTADIENFKQKIKLAENIISELKEIFDTNQKDENLETVKILYSRASIEDTLCKHEFQAETEVLAFCKEPYIMNLNQLDKFESSMKDSITKGVVHKAIYQVTSEEDGLCDILKEFSKLGEEIRVTEFLPLKLIIYDGKIAILTFENKKINSTFTSLADEDVAKTFKMIFEIYWSNATPLHQYLKAVE